MTRWILLLIACLIPSTASAQPYKVFITTETGQFVDEDTKARLDSVADLRKEIAQKKFKKVFALAEARESADFVLNVLFRGKVDSGSRTGTSVSWTQGTADSKSDAVMQNSLQVQLVMGEYQTDLWGVKAGERNLFGPNQRNWRQQAEHVIDQLEEWCHDNKSQLAK